MVWRDNVAEKGAGGMRLPAWGASNAAALWWAGQLVRRVRGALGPCGASARDALLARIARRTLVGRGEAERSAKAAVGKKLVEDVEVTLPRVLEAQPRLLLSAVAPEREASRTTGVRPAEAPNARPADYPTSE